MTSILICVFVLDVNECLAQTDGCTHICRNEEGSYSCDCNTGYTLAPDGYSCEGKYILSEKSNKAY